MDPIIDSRQWLGMLFFASVISGSDKNVFDYTLKHNRRPARASLRIQRQSGDAGKRCQPLWAYAAIYGAPNQFTRSIRSAFCDHRIAGQQFWRTGAGNEPGNQDFLPVEVQRDFPMMSKVSVKGNDKTPLYQYLTDKSANPKTGGDIQWNFTKFLVGPGGQNHRTVRA